MIIRSTSLIHASDPCCMGAILGPSSGATETDQVCPGGNFPVTALRLAPLETTVGPGESMARF